MLFGEDWLAEQGLVLAGLLAAMLCLVFRHPLVLVILLLLLCPLALHQVGSPASPELAVLFIVLVFRVAGILWPAGQAADGRGNGACMLMVTGALLALRADEFIVLVAGVELFYWSGIGHFACQSPGSRTGEAVLKGLVLGLAGTALILMGSALVWLVAEGSGAALVGAALHQGWAPALGAVLILCGMSCKFGLFPFPMGLPDFVEGTPTGVGILWLTLSRILLVPVWFTMLSTLDSTGPGGDILGWLVGMTLFVGFCMALVQSVLRRMIGWLGVGAGGLLLLPLTRGGNVAEGMETVMLWTAVGMALGLCGWAVVMQRLEGRDPVELHLDDLAGLFRSRPDLAMLLMVFPGTLAGILPGFGFAGIYMLLMGLGEGRFNGPLAGGLVAWGVILFTILRLFVRLGTEPTRRPALTVPPASPLQAVTLVLLSVTLFLSGWLLAGWQWYERQS